MNEGEEEKEITKENVELALKAVATTVFLHQALEIQKLWMNCWIFILVKLITQQTSATVNRLKPLFPGGSENSKFARNGNYWPFGMVITTCMANKIRSRWLHTNTRYENMVD